MLKIKNLKINSNFGKYTTKFNAKYFNHSAISMMKMKTKSLNDYKFETEKNKYVMKTTRNIPLYINIRTFATQDGPTSNNKRNLPKKNEPKESMITKIKQKLKQIPEWKVIKVKLINLPEVIKDELIHYWTGFKLLFKNMKLSTQLVLRILKGEKLKRSESALLERTVADTFRLVPFIIIIIVPFMEFALPVLLKLFPNMLPSTFTTKDQKQQKLEKQIQARLGLAKFLQGATEKLLLEEIKGGITEEDFTKFTKKIKNGEYISNDEIIKIGRVFKNRFEFNNLSMERIQALCAFFGIPTYGPRSYLIFQLETKLKRFKDIDEQIMNRGTEGLSMEELVQINIDRGMKVEGRNRMMLIKQLYDWIQLSTHRDVPKFLLLLSRSFAVNQGSSEISKAINELSIDEINDIIKDLPDEADEFQKRLDELNEIEKEKKKLAKEKKEEEERKKREEEERRKREEEEKKKREEEEKKKLEEGKKRLEEEKIRLEEEKKKLEEEKKKLEEEQVRLKQEQSKKFIVEDVSSDLEVVSTQKEELKTILSDQKFIQQLEDSAQLPQAELLTDKIEEMIKKSELELEKIEVEKKKNEEKLEENSSQESSLKEQQKLEEQQKIEEQQQQQQKLSSDQEQQQIDSSQLEKDEKISEVLDIELKSVSHEQQFIQQLEDSAQLPQAEKLTDKIEAMIEKSRIDLEKLQKIPPKSEDVNQINDNDENNNDDSSQIVKKDDSQKEGSKN